MITATRDQVNNEYDIECLLLMYCFSGLVEQVET